MTDCPLTTELLERLIRGEAKDDERESLAGHLAGPCPECDRFFAGMDGLTREILVKACLARKITQGDDPTLTEKEKEEIFEAVARDLPFIDGAPNQDNLYALKSRPLRWALLAAAMVMACTATFWVISSLNDPTGLTSKDGSPVKGSGIILQFLAANKTQDKEAIPRIERGRNQASYGADASLLFRFELETPSWVYLVRLGRDGKDELISPAAGEKAVEMGPGVYDVSRGDKIMVYPLSGLQDIQTFCALALPAEPSRAGEALQKARTEVEKDRNRFISGRLRKPWIDCFQIKVER